ncbi:GNAT family N-acetyltransferase [Microvirga antarctica]|uniref:GNAT family N-acetyltransferase n=1 Tax=Microvirga antarctica TaxID=2819233 RepID=UPI001B30B02F|nr:GNAT family N-acetyltransferase [Microvirga antarctica]
MTITVRTALPRDRDVVIELIHQLNIFEADLTGDRLRDYGAATRYHAELLQRLATWNGRIILADDDGVVVGAMGFAVQEDAAYMVPDARRYGVVTDLVVDRHRRGAGIGRLLLQEAERLTREAGVKRLTIGVLSANASAARTYRAFGFDPYMTVMVKAV